MKRFFTGIVLALMFSSSTCLAQWVSNRSQLDDTFSNYNAGLLVGGCVIAGAGIITALLLDNPEPVIAINGDELPAGLEKLKGYPEPLKITWADGCTYGKVRSVESPILGLTTRSDTAKVGMSTIRHIVDLPSAARQSRVSKTKWFIAGAGTGVGIILIAASENSSGSSFSTTKMLLCATGSGLLLSGLVAAMIRSEDERELREWRGEADDEEEGSKSASGIRTPQVSLALMPVARLHPSGRTSLELVPSIQARITLW